MVVVQAKFFIAYRESVTENCMSTAYTKGGTNGSAKGGTKGGTNVSSKFTSGMANKTGKTRMREQLYRIIEDLSESQATLLLMQAQNLSTVSSDFETSSIEDLSKRELEVLVLVANGYNRKSIGSTLGISVNTAARHIANIYSKLGISTVAEATCYAYHSHVIGGIQGVEHSAGLRV